MIRRQQQRVRDRFPDVAPARLRLLPRPKTNPEGTKPVSDIASRHRKWVDSLPDLTVPVITTETGLHASWGVLVQSFIAICCAMEPRAQDLALLRALVVGADGACLLRLCAGARPPSARER